MNKRCMSKIGTISLIAAILITATLLASIFIVSATKPEYSLGEKIRIETKGIGEYTLSIKTPDQTLIQKSEKPFFIYQPETPGEYTIEIDAEGFSKKIDFTVNKHKSKEELEPKEEPEPKEELEPKEEPEPTEKLPQKEIIAPTKEKDRLAVVDEIKVGEKVKWKTKINSENQTEVKIKIPSVAENISVLENGARKDFNVEEAGTIRQIINLISADDNEKEVSIENITEEVELSYETPASIKEEEIVSKFEKRVTVSSPDEIHYENVLSFTEIEEMLNINQSDLIKIYWEEENKNLNFKAYDKNNNGLIDYIEWVIPHLSTQTFNVSIDILNVQSYPYVSGNWTVKFNTLGTANLYIRAINETTFGNSLPDDLNFLELKCGDELINYDWVNESIFIENYNCNETAYETSLVMTEGKHYLEFEFGSVFGYARNDAANYTPQTCSGVWGFDCGESSTSNPGGDSDNTFDSCTSQNLGATTYGHVDEVYINGTSLHPGNSLQVTCEFDPYSADDEQYIWYYNGTGDSTLDSSWYLMYSGNAPSGTIHNVTATIIANDTLGTHWVRCIDDYSGESDVCANVGSGHDNDDLNFSVVSTENSTSEIFSTPGWHNYTVPAGVNEIMIKTWGAGGGGGAADDATGPGGAGAGGGYAQANISVTPLENLTIHVAGGGGAGTNGGTGGGGGGGGRTSIYRGTTPLLIAGAGGGGGGGDNSAAGVGAGGVGGGSTGGTGGSASAGTTGGAGGTQAAGGTGGSGANAGTAGGSASNGSSNYGGEGGNSGAGPSDGTGGENNGGTTRGGDGGNIVTNNFAAGGGAGNGYYGGGGGGSSTSGQAGGGGGGGGSNYLTGTGQNNSQASGVTPPATGDSDYISGVGVGGGGGAAGSGNPGTAGGNGLMVISYTITSNAEINTIECEEAGSWKNCSEVDFGETITRVRANVTASEGYITEVNFTLTNIPDSNEFFSSNATSVSGDYWIYNNIDVTIDDSGSFELQVRAEDNDTSYSTNTSEWSVPWGTLLASLISPNKNENVSQYEFFTFRSQVACTGGECGYVNATLDPIAYNNSNGVAGTSFSLDIGSPGNNRLVVITSDVESSGTNLTGATVDGDACNLVVRADNSNGIGNHQEMWYCDEDDFGSSSGSVTVAITGGSASWGTHAQVFTGVSQDGPLDSGIDETSAGITTITVTGIDVSEDGLVVAGWAEGTQGLSINSQTSPLSTILNGPDPSSADLFSSSGIESSAQSSKTYSVTLSGSHNRATGIVASWDEALAGGAKGVIPMNSGTPFYTTTQNPTNYSYVSCLADMKAGDSCQTSWEVNATGAMSSKWEFFTIYEATNYSAYVTSNQTPTINLTISDEASFGSVRINSSDGTDQSSQDLNCFTTLNNGEDANISLIWYKNGGINLSIDYNNTYTDGTFFNSVLNSGNTSVGENWSCGMRFYYNGNYTEWFNSSILTILPVPPAIGLEVIYPTTTDVYVEQYEFFNVTFNLTCTQGNCGTINVTLDPIQQTYNDFETGTEGFEHIPLNEKNDQWHISTESAHNGSQSWKYGDTGTGDYLDFGEAVLVTPAYTMTANSTFDFYHYMWVEGNGYDGGVLQYRLDGGTWTKFTNFISGGYNDQYNDYNGGPPFIDGEDIWGGGTIGSPSSFAQVVLNLSELSGDEVEFRFYFFADASINEEGWYIDSVNFTTEIPGTEKGIIPVGNGTPFYTNATSNPLTSNSLDEGESQLITFFVNATGALDSIYTFFGYANLTSNLSTGNRTQDWNVTISIEQELPNITINYPTSGTINDATPVLDINLTGAAKKIWYNIDGGANKTLCLNCDSSDTEVLYLREDSYTVNVFVSNSMGEENSKSVSFDIDMNNNYYDTFLDDSHIITIDDIEAMTGNVTLSLEVETIINETFDDSEDWSLVGGQWILSSGELVQTLATDDTIAIYNKITLNNITNYNISTRVYPENNDHIGIIFGYENSSNYYRCRLYLQGTEGDIERIEGGATTSLATATTMYTENAWNDFLVEIKNETISCYIDGTLTAQATNVSLPEGKVGIYNDNHLDARYDNFTTTITGGRKSGSFISYSVDLVNTITKFLNITWNEFTTSVDNSIKVEVSADDGDNWYEATKNEGLSTVNPGDEFIYRVFFNVENLSIISLLDLNITWSNSIEPPPSIYIEGIDTPTEQDFTPAINVTLNGTASALLMSINGVNQTICTTCSGSRLIPVVLEEIPYTIAFFANNSVGTTSTNSTSFTVDFDKHHYDNYSDNYSIKEINDVIWSSGNVTLYSTSYNTSASSTWDANDQTGDGTWANSGRSDYSFRNVLEAGSISDDGEFVRIKFVSATDTALGINSPSICERSGSTSDCVGSTWANLTFGGSQSYVIPVSSQAWSDWLEYDIDETKDYLVTFYEDNTNTGVSYLSPSSSMVYSSSGNDYSSNVNWSGLSPTFENLMYGVDEMEVKDSILGGAGNFTSHVMNASQEATSISHISWSEAGVSANNNISVEISVDNGANWNVTTNGGSVTGFTPGSNILYRVLFAANSVANISIQDINFTWESPPTVEILYPETYVYNQHITTLNYTISYASGVSLDTCWYSLNNGTTNTTMICNQNITGITSVDGPNTWTVYANDSDGMLGQESVTFIIDTSAPVITFINQTDEDGDIVDDTNPLFDGENMTINVNVSDSSLSKVWVIIWEGIIGGVEKARFFLSNIFGDLWGGDIETDETYGGDYNYTIYANDTTGLESNYSGNFSVINLNATLSLNPNPVGGNESVYMIGSINLSNGTSIPNNAINFWFDGTFIPFENLTNGGNSFDVLNFTEDEIKIFSSYQNVTYSNGNFSLDGTNTSGSFTGVLDAGAMVNWEKAYWDMVSESCSGTVDVQDGDSNSYSGTEDTYIISGTPNDNYGTELDLTVDSSNPQGYIERSLVKFNNVMGFGENKVPYDSTISSATLRLTVYDTGDNPNFYEILENWTEDDATYIYRTDSDLWSSEGVAGSPSITTTSIGSMSTATTGTKSLSVTNTVGKWANRTISNNGFAVHPLASGGVKFRSRGYSTVGDRPRLTVAFSSSDCTGAVIQVRTSNNKSSWTDWTEVVNGGNITDSLGISRYLEYKVEMGAFNSSFNPQMLDLKFNYTGAFTDSNGLFNYSFISIDTFGTYDVNVTSGYRTMTTNAMSSLDIQSLVAPYVELLSPSNETWFSIGDLNLTYNATDLNGDLNSSTLILDGIFNKTNQSTIVNGPNNFTLNGVSEGTHTWSVNLTDTTETDTSETWTFYIDLTDPTVNLISPPNESNFTVNILNLSFITTDNMDSNLSCDVVLDGNTIHSGEPVPNNTAINFSSGTLTGGNYSWNVTCTDEALRNFTSETWTFEITDTPPVVSLVIPNDNDIDTDGDIEFIYFPEDNTGINKCELLINGVVNETNNSIIGLEANNSFNITGFADGFYNWTVRCYDLSNSSSMPNNRTIRVDLNSPTISLISPDNESTSNSSTVNFTFNANDSIDSELNCSLLIDGTNESSFLTTSGINSSEILSGLDDGPKNWRIDCSDDSGRTGQSETRMVNITESPKVYVNNTNSTYNSGNSFMVYFTPYDNTDIDSCSIYLNGILNKTQSSGLSIGAMNNMEFEGLATGRYTYYVECTDGIGLSNVSQEYEFFIDALAPIIEIHFPKNEGVFAQNISFDFKVIDDLSINSTCNLSIDDNLNVTNFSVSNDTNSSIVVSGVSDGFHEWNLTCWDLAGNVNNSDIYNFTKYTSPGVNLVSPANGTWMNVSNFNFTYIPQDDEGFSKTELILNGSIYMENQTAIVNAVNNSFEVTLADGVYNWSVNATDLSSMAGESEQRIVYVDTNAPKLDLIYPLTDEVVDDNNVTFTFNITDNLDDSISCNLSIDGEVEFSGNLSNGTNIIGILLSDGNKTWSVNCWDDASNMNISQTINFSVFAPPKINLNTPANELMTTNSTINFGYTPIDAIGILNCSIYIDEILEESNTSIIKNVANNFTVTGIPEGKHNWTVECTDSDSNINRSLYRNFTRDLTPPFIQLNSPPNGTGIDANDPDTDFNWTGTDALDTLLTCNLTVDGNIEDSGFATSGVPRIESVSGLSIGEHYWNVSCADTVGNTNTSLTYVFNRTYSDLQINQSQIFFNSSNPTEGENITITATVHNLGVINMASVEVEFYSGDPDTTGTQIGATQIISVSALNSTNASITWDAEIGATQIFVKVDPSDLITENSETNNKANKTITVSSWHLFYGEINSNSESKLADSLEAKVVTWNGTGTNSKIYVADYDSNVDWTALQAIGKKPSGTNSTNDIQEIDTILNSSTFLDSLEVLYLDAGEINETQDLIIFGKQIQNIPVATSINSSSFKTGILWDYSDDTDLEYDTTEKEDIIFVTRISKDTAGSYEVTDYELRVPALLRNYHTAEQTTAAFYMEIN